MKKLEVKFQRAPGECIPVGTLAEEGRRVYFEYHADFLKTGIPLSPFKLPLHTGLLEHTDRHIGDLPGLFSDSGSRSIGSLDRRSFDETCLPDDFPDGQNPRQILMVLLWAEDLSLVADL